MTPRTITVVGLGPGPAALLTLQTLDTLRAASCVILRTARHPAAEELPAHGVRFTACDDLYERHGDFEAVYAAVVTRVLDAAEAEGQVVYAVPGDPLAAEITVRLLLDAAAADDSLTVTVLPALGALNLLMGHLPGDPAGGLLIANARDPRLRPANEAPAPNDHEAFHGARALVNPALATLWLQVDTPLVASDLKIVLLEHYPPDHPVTVMTALGSPDEQVTISPLADLDRGPAIMHLTSVYIPPLPWEARRHTPDDLRAIMALLRSERGCPWDRAQDMRDLRRTLIEEAYEAAEAMSHDDPEAIADELGDVLLHIYFVAQIAAEEGVFDIDDVVGALAGKLIRRHAHIFGDVEADSPAAVLRSWEHIKAGERAAKGAEGLFSDVPLAFPALIRATKLQMRAARVGFDWADFRGPLMKVYEEVEELTAELGLPPEGPPSSAATDIYATDPAAQHRAENAPTARLVHEVGDVLFAVVNICRFLHVDAEDCLREANDRFLRRFARMEAAISAEGKHLGDLSLPEMDAAWLAIKGDD